MIKIMKHRCLLMPSNNLAATINVHLVVDPTQGRLLLTLMGAKGTTLYNPLSNGELQAEAEFLSRHFVKTCPRIESEAAKTCLGLNGILCLWLAQVFCECITLIFKPVFQNV